MNSQTTRTYGFTLSGCILKTQHITTCCHSLNLCIVLIFCCVHLYNLSITPETIKLCSSSQLHDITIPSFNFYVRSFKIILPSRYHRILKISIACEVKGIVDLSCWTGSFAIKDKDENKNHVNTIIIPTMKKWLNHTFLI